jgi:hypothetical protein
MNRRAAGRGAFLLPRKRDARTEEPPAGAGETFLTPWA